MYSNSLSLLVACSLTARRSARAMLCSLVAAPVLVACDTPRTIQVTSPDDSGPGSLRAAISSANEGTNSAAVRIELPSGTYVLSRCGADDGNVSGDLDVLTDRPVVIAATGPNVVVQQTCDGERVLDAHGAGLLTLSGVTITGGRLSGAALEDAVRGGGVRTAANLRLERASITGNIAKGAPGRSAPAGGAASDGQAALGGGVYVAGSLEAIDSTLSKNLAQGGRGEEPELSDGLAAAAGRAEGGGAWVARDVSFRGGAIEVNIALAGSATIRPGGSARGGGIAQNTAAATVRIEGASIKTNLAQGGDAKGTVAAGDASGGAVASAGPLFLASVTATDNSATGGANPGNVNGASSGAARGGAFACESSATVNTSTFTNNRATGGQGAFTCIASMFFPTQGYQDCFGAEPSPAAGGAVWASGALSIVSSQFTSNVASAGTGAVRSAFTNPITNVPSVTYWVPARADGGAAASGAALSVDGGAFSGNLATSEQPALFVMFGGGGFATNAPVAERGSALNADSISVRSAHFADNTGYGEDGQYATMTSAVSASNAVDLRDTELRHSRVAVAGASVSAERVTIADSVGQSIVAWGDVLLVNATLSNNHAGLSAARLELRHATVTDALPANQAQFATNRLLTVGSVVVNAPDSAICNTGVVVESSSYNWFTDATCALAGAGDHQSDASGLLLAALTNNGGAVPTRAPAPESVLVDAMPVSACAAAVDARGVSRPQGNGCDIGAVEVQSP